MMFFEMHCRRGARAEPQERIRGGEEVITVPRHIPQLAHVNRDSRISHREGISADIRTRRARRPVHGR